MVNKENLIVPTSEQAREYGKKGGQKSAESRQRKKLLKDAMQAMLDATIEKDGKELSGAEMLAFTAFTKALGGDIKAMEFVRDTAGQKPVERVMVSDVDPAVIEEVEQMVMSDDDAE